MNSYFRVFPYHKLTHFLIRMAPQMEMSVGLEKGHKVTKLPKRAKPSQRKGHRSKRVKFIRDVIREVCSFWLKVLFRSSLSLQLVLPSFIANTNLV